VAQRTSSVGVTSLHECHFSPTYAASGLGPQDPPRTVLLIAGRSNLGLANQIAAEMQDLVTIQALLPVCNVRVA